MVKLNITPKKLVAKIKFNKDTATKLSNLAYYKAQARNNIQLEHLGREKLRLGTPKLQRIDALLEKFKNLGYTTPSSAGKIMKGLYDKNVAAAKKNLIPINSNILSIVAKPDTLMLAYKAIKGNKGALTPRGAISEESYNNMSFNQKRLYKLGLGLPDGMSILHFELMAQLLRKGKYPWGTSLRIYLEKPGQPDKLRPITMPPFMDKVVQKAIELVLQCIYEPVFEKANRSFGFRPNQSTLDALTALTSDLTTNGMRTALEGDIEGAYDNVNRKTLMGILGKRIHDRKFLKLIESRLNYDFVEKDTGTRVRPSKGIPQGGIDSPYLFNIYMLELDEYILNTLNKEIEAQNKKIKARHYNKVFTSIKAYKKRLLRHLSKGKKKLKNLLAAKQSTDASKLRIKLFGLIRQIRIQDHRKNKVSSSTSNRKELRYFYVRYADDWILLTNGSKDVAAWLKEKIAHFLKEKLSLTLSEHKTLITNIRESSARFLGFELKISKAGALTTKPNKNKKLTFKRQTTHRKSGLLVYCKPDRQRLLDRFHMKGFCSEEGTPLTLPWLSTLEPYAIVERYNSVIRGLANYYLPIIRNKATIHRWIYILRFSCLKTLAQKYKCSIKQIFKRFGINLHLRSKQTIRITVVQRYEGKLFSKDWTLLTYADLINSKIPLELGQRAKDKFEAKEINKDLIGEYPLQTGNLPKVTNEDFLKSISWVSWRTRAALDMPCAHCGTDKDVHQHHIKHIRKRAYTLIPPTESYQRIMALRNRKQIPLCQNCHIKLVHQGKYDGPKLIKLAPKEKLYDNRIIHVESFVKPGKEYHSKPIWEKGWSLYEPKKKKVS